MLKSFRTFVLGLSLALSSTGSFAQVEGAVSAGAGVAQCASSGLLASMTSAIDWNNFTITIFGIPIGKWPNPPLMWQPPVCYCPSSLFGITLPGIGSSFWEPVYLVEVEKTPGCLRTFGTNVLGGAYSSLASYADTGAESQNTVNRMQIHWYLYPLASLLNLFEGMACKTPPAFDVMMISEILPTHQSDLLNVWLHPEAVLTANPVAMLAGPIDAVASSLHFPLDALYWVAGSWGDVSISSGNSTSNNTSFQSNAQILSKHLVFLHRVGLLWGTIGPPAICFSYPAPIWIKSQYRYNQVAPIPRVGILATGGSGLTQFPLQTNLPTQESTTYMIWQGKQCCTRF